MANGVDRPYPIGHRGLLERVADLGLLVSEVPPGDCVAAGCQRRSVGRSFDAVRASGHDYPFRVGEVGGQFRGDMLAV